MRGFYVRRRACSSCKLWWKEEDRDADGGIWGWAFSRIIYRSPVRTFAFYISLDVHSAVPVIAPRGLETRPGTASAFRLPAPPLPSLPGCPLPATAATPPENYNSITPGLPGPPSRKGDSSARRYTAFNLGPPTPIPALLRAPPTSALESLLLRTGRGLRGGPGARDRCLGREG